MEKWYKNLYRRNLVDMHINDTNDVYLSKFSAEDYFNYLKAAKIEGPMIYLQSHAGLCNFPTKVSRTHKYFLEHKDELKKLIKLCKDDGMKVVGYYSLIYNNQAGDAHPEWEMISPEGHIWREDGQRYGKCCLNNKEYRKFITTQLEEIRDEYDNLDALFFDMPMWEINCQCDGCKEAWKKYSEKPIPTKEDFNDLDWLLLVKARQEMMGEFVKFVREETNRILPEVTVEFNFAAVIGMDHESGSTELINAECEFTGGDLYGDLYSHSFTAKYYYGITKNQPFEYMTCRANKSLREHTISKNNITLESEIMLSCMHHGASLIIDAINPDGTLDMRVAHNIGGIFDIQQPYEKYMDKGELYADIAVFFDSKTQFKSTELPHNKTCAVNTTRTLIENHIPHHIIANYNLNNLNKYKMIIAPSLQNFDNPELDKFIEYVANGGTLYISGKGDSRLLKEFFDGEVYGETHGGTSFRHFYKGFDEIQAYINPLTEQYKEMFGEFNETYPLPIKYRLPLFRHKKGEVVANMILPFTNPDDVSDFASIHSNPPGYVSEYPAIIETTYGKGRVIYSVAPIECDERYNFKEIFVKLIKNNYKNRFEVNGSKYVEAIWFKNGEDFYLNLFDLNFANDIVTRNVEVTLDDNSYKVSELLSGKEIELTDNKFNVTFNKYLSLKIERK